MKSRAWLRYFRITVAIVLFVATFAKKAPAQTGSGSIHGVVQDQTGGAVPNATIAVTSADGQTTPATANRDGIFDVRGLEPGKYSVTVTVSGFSPYKKDSVQIAGGQTLQLTVSLSIQTQTEQVTVSGDAPTALDVTPSNNASALVLTENELAALPDDPDELETDLQALAGPSPGPNGGQMYIDGFTAGQLPPKSSIREIRVNSNPFSAEYDKVGYGRIEIFTKPGTDKWHGQVFVNENNAILNSKDPFAPEKPPFESTQVNGNVGGPLSKRASIFLNLDYRDIQNQEVVSAYTGLNGTTPIPFSQVVGSPHTRINFSPRLDYQLTKNNTLSIRYQYFYNNNMYTGVGAFNLASTGYNQLSSEQTVQVSDTQVIGTKIINETHFQFLRDDSNDTPLSLQPTINVSGAFTGGGSNSGSSQDYANHYELQNYTSIALAKHFIKFGGRLRLITDANTTTGGFNGYFSFASLAAYASATPTPNQFTYTVGAPLAKLSAEDTGLYVEDDWRVRPNITFSYGLRFETQNHISDHFDWAPRLGLAWGLGKSKTSPKTVLRAGFGVFYDRFQEDNILQAERQALGDPLQQQFVISPTSGSSANLASLYSACSASISAAGCQTAIMSAGTSTNTPTFYQIAPNLHAPYSLQTAVSVERQVTKVANVSVSYLHTSGYDQFLINNVNTPLNCNTAANPMCVQSPSLRPNGVLENVYQYQSDGVFTQNQLIVNANVRAGAKITLNGFYTLNYADGDTNSTSPNSIAFSSNPYYVRADYGRSPFDIRHRGLISGTVILPWDLHLSPFMVVQSGVPYNLTLNQDLIGSSITTNQRPAFASSCSATGVVSTQFGCFNPNPVDEPTSGSALVPINYLTSTARFALNLRLTKSFGFGKLAEGPTGPRRGGGGGGGPRGGGGGRGPGGGGGPFGAGGGGGGGGGGVAKRYNFTLSVNARNIFNNVNYATPIGVITSPLLGRSNDLAGGTFSNSTSGANRQVFLQLQFAF